MKWREGREEERKKDLLLLDEPFLDPEDVPFGEWERRDRMQMDMPIFLLDLFARHEARGDLLLEEPFWSPEDSPFQEWEEEFLASVGEQRDASPDMHVWDEAEEFHRGTGLRW